MDKKAKRIKKIGRPKKYKNQNIKKARISFPENLLSQLKVIQKTEGYGTFSDFIISKFDKTLIQSKNNKINLTQEDLKGLTKLKKLYLEIWSPIANNLNQIAKALNKDSNNRETLNWLNTIKKEMDSQNKLLKK